MSPIHCKEIQITLNTAESKSKNTNMFDVIVVFRESGALGLREGESQDDRHMR